MTKHLFVAMLLVSAFAIHAPSAQAGEKCQFTSQSSGKIYCRYTWKKKKSKLREWAREYCLNNGWAKEINDIRYGSCNKRGKKCRWMTAYCGKKK